MRYKLMFTILMTSFLSFWIFAQSPVYTPKSFVSNLDTTEFRNSTPLKDGKVKSYLLTEPAIWDVDDNNTTHVLGGGKSCVLLITGFLKNNKKNGIFTYYLIDSLDHSRTFRIWEQSYADDKLNGEWKTYNLKGTLVKTQQFKNDSLNGISREYGIDGKTVIEEQEYFNGRNKYKARTYFSSGKLEKEQTFENNEINGYSKEYYENGKLKEYLTVKDGILNGVCRKYYDTGILMEEVEFRQGQFHNIRKYYHPNGKIWLVQEFNNGLPWTIIGNYDAKGIKRDAGTLKNGTGTVLYYNDDGTLRESISYLNGKIQ